MRYADRVPDDTLPFFVVIAPLVSTRQCIS